MLNMSNPTLILLFSGKRKSGKDFITEKLFQNFGSDDLEIIRISAPIKQFWAKQLDLDFSKLMDNTLYKEKYRKEMIDWSDEIRSKDYGFFCREATNKDLKQIVIVSDIRRKNDIKWFQENYKDLIKTVRIIADDESRKNRGWIFEKGVDDVQSECDLDDWNKEWDFLIDNSSNKIQNIDCLLKEISHFIETKIRK